MNCTLCQSTKTETFHKRDDKTYGPRVYFKCGECGLIFLDPKLHLSRAEEKKRYDTHENDPEDEKYQTFLKRLTDPLSQKLTAGMKGLDFGSGPGPAVSALLSKCDVATDHYDPFYAADKSLLSKKYDFIASSETVEHFCDPREEFQLLDTLLKRGGVLGVMTQVYDRQDDFGEWWYQRDPTHVCFYQNKTFDWITKWLGWSLEHPAANVILFTKNH